MNDHAQDTQMQYKIGRIDTKVDGLVESVGRIEKLLDGNGQLGIRVRLDRVERVCEAVKSARAWRAGIVAGLIVAVTSAAFNWWTN